MNAKIYKLIFIGVAMFALSGCNQWLDIDPEDSTTEDELFETGQGYRNALNGVYTQMATQEMYGREMEWGLVDVAAQYYLTGRSNMSSSGAYSQLATKYNYQEKKVKNKIEKIWSLAYNSIANCNNLLSRIEGETPSKFTGKKLEQDMIHGEALALRALLHFDMLRLFAPAPVKDDGRAYIPYFEKYPSLFEAKQPVTEILSRIRRDLETAKTLVAPFDTLESHKMWNSVKYRFEANGGEHTEWLTDDLFYAYRGYRLNYYAICGLLARVYNYSGMHQEAYEETLKVIGSGYQDVSYFTFTSSININDGNRKLYDDLLFALSNEKLFDIYDAVNGYELNDGISFNLSGYDNMFDDNSDYRQKYLTEKTGGKAYCNKYLRPNGGKLLTYAQDMIPMIRLSELYYIQAEYFFRYGTLDQVKQALDAVRMGRGCTIGKLNITDEDSFNKELLKEAKREFMGEGQLFYYYKKLGIRPSANMTSDDKFIFPLPDNETVK